MAPTRQSGPRTPRKCKESVAKTTASNGSPAKTSKSKNTLSKISRDKRPRGTSIKLSPKKAGKLAEAVAEASTAGNPVAGPGELAQQKQKARHWLMNQSVCS